MFAQDVDNNNTSNNNNKKKINETAQIVENENKSEHATFNVDYLLNHVYSHTLMKSAS